MNRDGMAIVLYSHEKGIPVTERDWDIGIVVSDGV
jgi:hypothetical protein